MLDPFMNKLSFFYFLWLFLNILGSDDGQSKESTGCRFLSSPGARFVSLNSPVDSFALLFKAAVHPSDAELMIASVRSNNIERANFTSKFRLEGPDSEGNFAISTIQPLRLPPYPFPFNETMLYATVVCNGEAYPLMTIRVKSMNVHTPFFYHQPYEVLISEATPIGTEIDTPVLAVDWDPAHDYPITFEILNNSSPFSLVSSNSVHSTDFLPPVALNRWRPEQLPAVVRLRVDKVLDFETQPNHFLLNISAKDNGQPPNVNHTQILVKLVDFDDFPPKFTSDDYLAVMPRNWKVGSTLSVSPPLKAVDGDLGINKSIIYRLDANAMDTFTIDEQSGEITIIDEKAAIPETIIVTATQSDREARSTSTRIKLVTDLPKPSFDNCFVSVSLPENSPIETLVASLQILHRTEKTQVNLIDPDGTFRISSPSSSSSTVQLFIQNPRLLDRELFSTLEVVLTIEDSTPSVSEENSCQKTRVHIDLVDVNDNGPHFERDEIRLWVGDETHDGDILLTLKATDIDQGENGRLSYSIRVPDKSNGIPIEVQQANGAASLLYIAAKDSFERINKAFLVAKDHGNPQKIKEIPIEMYRRRTVHSIDRFVTEGVKKTSVSPKIMTRASTRTSTERIETTPERQLFRTKTPTTTFETSSTTRKVVRTTETPTTTEAASTTISTTEATTTATATQSTTTVPEQTTQRAVQTAPSQFEETNLSSSDFLWKQIEFLRQNGVIGPIEVPTEAELQFFRTHKILPPQLSTMQPEVNAENRVESENLNQQKTTTERERTVAPTMRIAETTAGGEIEINSTKEIEFLRRHGMLGVPLVPHEASKTSEPLRPIETETFTKTAVGSGETQKGLRVEQSSAELAFLNAHKMEGFVGVENKHNESRRPQRVEPMIRDRFEEAKVLMEIERMKATVPTIVPSTIASTSVIVPTTTEVFETSTIEEEVRQEQEESVSIPEDKVDENPPEPETEEPVPPPVFHFIDDNYKIELYGPLAVGEKIGRVVASPQTEAYGIDRRVFGKFGIDFDGGWISLDENIDDALNHPGTFRFHVSATDGVKTVGCFD